MANRLSKESSPYLLQHANNPVDWYPWGAEALEKAKTENKLLLISIGYSACHWCHVMEHESFENEAIAHLMNEHFVCIKVDREERADIDQIYMQAVQLMTGRGGWPLNCFALPDGRPVYGGTYFPSAQWTNILEALSKAFQETPDKFNEYAEKLTLGLHDPIIEMDLENQLPFESILTQSIEIIKKQFDWEFGGFKGAPKFPLPGALEFLLETAVLNKDEGVQNFVYLTLNKMADSGLYDQLGGGFARYSVDTQWKVPHFEKMLYDNAQLISLYSKAYQYKKEPRFKVIIEESLAYIQREMTNEYAGFYSAQDADSEGIEGKFYCWTKEELASFLGKDTELFERYFQCEAQGNWEKRLNILYPTPNTNDICKDYQLTNQELESKILTLKRVLFIERSKRVYPALDDKSISAWNGIMLNAFVDGFKALGHPEYLKSAKEAAGFIEKLMDDEGRIKRIFKENTIKIDGFLDDYAFSIKAFIDLYQITFNQKYLELAKRLNDFTNAHFHDKKSKLFFYTSNESQNLITRRKELTDNVIPSSNSAMAHNLFVLGTLLSEDKYIQQAREMVNQILTQIPKGREYFTNWGRLLFRFLHTSNEVVVMGDDCVNIAQQLQKEYHPLSYFVGSKTNAYLPLMENRQVLGETQIYVCKNKSCQLPTNKIEEAIQTIREAY